MNIFLRYMKIRKQFFAKKRTKSKLGWKLWYRSIMKYIFSLLQGQVFILFEYKAILLKRLNFAAWNHLEYHKKL